MTTDRDIQILKTGDEFFPALHKALAAAKREILFETYIYAEDSVGKAIAEALASAVARGVKVRLLIDGWGSHTLSEKFREALVQKGIEMRIYKALGWSWTNLSNFRRLHRKIVVVDGDIAFVGGINVFEEQVTIKGRPALMDYAISVRGPVVREIREELVEAWRAVNPKGEVVQPVGTQPASPNEVADGKIRFVSRDNFRNRHRIEKEYIERIRNAQSEILLANAYFVPSHPLRKALIQAARRGVKVRLIMQGRADLYLIRYAGRALYYLLLRAGVKIYENHNSVLHAKVAVFDREWLTIGSSNLDPLSLAYGLEANLFVDDARLATDLANQLESEIRGACRPVTLRDVSRWSWLFRMFLWGCYVTVRTMAYVFLPKRLLRRDRFL